MMNQHPTESELDTVLINQKDLLFKAINQGRYAEARLQLNFVKNLWNTCNYNYKWIEINTILNRRTIG